MATKNQAEISVMEIKVEQVSFCILGKTPIILNKIKGDSQRDLLMPKGKKTMAEKASSLKHNPVQEFRDSPYYLVEDDGLTLLAALAVWFKKALAGAALDIPGAQKSQIGRLVTVEGQRIPLYGIPMLYMANTRSADMNRTPDVRTRAIIPEWAVFLTVTFPVPILKVPTISNLLAAGGITNGVGDWRPQKGSGNYGQFELVQENDKRYKKIVAEGGHDAQVEAMKKAMPYDVETEDLLAWFKKEVEVRGFKGVAV